MKLLWCYLGIMSILLFVIMGWDKLSAMREKRRIPEATLFLLAVIGGAPGGVMGMICFRHKIRKPGFAVGFPLLAIHRAPMIVSFSTSSGPVARPL